MYSCIYQEHLKHFRFLYKTEKMNTYTSIFQNTFVEKTL